MDDLKIAIIGAGTAGLAAAALLRNKGHQVTLYEKFSVPKPLGAGLLLQPTGLSVLSLLDLDEPIIAVAVLSTVCKVKRVGVNGQH